MKSIRRSAVSTIFAIGQFLSIGHSAIASDPIVVNPTGTSGFASLQSVNGMLLFQASDNLNGHELWMSDGTPTGTVMIEDIQPGVSGSFPRGFTGLGGSIFFSADNGSNGHELRMFDVAASGTALVRDINPGPAGSFTGTGGPMTIVNGGLLFRALNNSIGYELWKSDGTEAGTVLVKDIIPGQAGSFPIEMTNVNGTVFFRADDGLPDINHRELWRSDGTEAGTVIVKDINPGPDAESVPGSLTSFNTLLIFNADDGTHGRELWRSDGTAAGTVMIQDINPSGPSFPGGFVHFNGMLFFTANDGTNGVALWKTDGTNAGTMLVRAFNEPPGSSGPNQLTNVNGTLFFTVTTFGALSHHELWKTDGTSAGTVVVKTFSPESAYPAPDFLTNVNGTLYFAANDGITGQELWKSDGTTAGTVLAADLNPGGAFSFSWPEKMTNVNGTLFFTADDGMGNRLWALDTSLPGDIDADGDVDIDDLNAIVNVLMGSELDPGYAARADLNGDNNNNGMDIRPFIDTLLGP